MYFFKMKRQTAGNIGLVVFLAFLFSLFTVVGSVGTASAGTIDYQKGLILHSGPQEAEKEKTVGVIRLATPTDFSSLLGGLLNSMDPDRASGNGTMTPTILDGQIDADASIAFGGAGSSWIFYLVYNAGEETSLLPPNQTSVYQVSGDTRSPVPAITDVPLKPKPVRGQSGDGSEMIKERATGRATLT